MKTVASPYPTIATGCLQLQRAREEDIVLLMDVLVHVRLQLGEGGEQGTIGIAGVGRWRKFEDTAPTSM